METKSFTFLLSLKWCYKKYLFLFLIQFAFSCNTKAQEGVSDKVLKQYMKK